MSFLTASVLRDLSFRTRLGWRPHTINTDSLASLHSTQLARLTLTTFFLPRSIKRISDEGVSSWIDDDYRRSWAANTNTPSRHSNQNYHYSPYRNSAVHKKRNWCGENPPFGALASLHSVELASLVRPHASLSLIVGGARILVEFAFAPPPPRATANRENRNAWHWRNMRRATARSTSSASQQPRAKAGVDRAMDEDLYPGCRLLRLRCGRAFGDPPHAAPCLQTEPYPNAVKMQGAQTAWQEEAASP